MRITDAQIHLWSTGLPSNDAEGLENSGEKSQTARKTRIAPSPSAARRRMPLGLARRPYPTNVIPNATRTMAMIVRRVPSPDPNRNPSRIAATASGISFP